MMSTEVLDGKLLIIHVVATSPVIGGKRCKPRVAFDDKLNTWSRWQATFARAHSFTGCCDFPHTFAALSLQWRSSLTKMM